MFARVSNTRSVEVTTAPAGLPVTLAEVKQMLRVSDSGDDTTLTRQLGAATAAVEGYLNRSLVTRTLTLVIDAFPDIREASNETTSREAPFLALPQSAINLPMSPVQSISSLTYLDQDNQTQIVPATDYTLDTAGERLLLNSGSSWPTNARDKAAVRIQYIAGYGADGSAVPAAIVEAIYQVACRLYEGRGCCGTDEAIASVMGLLAPFRLRPAFGRTY